VPARDVCHARWEVKTDMTTDLLHMTLCSLVVHLFLEERTISIFTVEA
jgi:hypothetical protein